MSDEDKHRLQQHRDSTQEEREERTAKKMALEIERGKLRAEVLALRIKGKSYEAIAKKYGKSRAWAYDIVKTALRGVWVEKAETLYKLEMLRFDRLQNRVTPLALGKLNKDGSFKQDPDMNAIKALLAISDRRKAWEETIYGRRNRAADRIEMPPEKRAFLEAGIRELELQYENQNAGIRHLEGTVSSCEVELVERNDDRRSGEVEMV